MSKKPGKRRWSLTLLYSTAFFLIQLAAVLITAALSFLLTKLGVLDNLGIPRNSGFAMLIVMLLISVLVGSVVAIGTVKIPLRPFNRLINNIDRLAAGDFTARMHYGKVVGDNPVFQELSESFNAMAEELENTQMLRSDFINNFSHEFKTPIVSIRGFARQLQRDDITDEERREYATIIADESTRLANLATNILLLSKLENQQIVTEKTAFRLDEQLRSCILLLEKQWEQKHLELVIDLEEVTCYGNAEMLSQAWVNLINNAIKFTPEGGTIGISLVAVDDTATVQVSDTGIGMDRETQQHIFEKFYQGDKSHHGEGNGLGLAMVKRIIALSRGKITVDSVKGKGTTFTVQLPVKG